MYIHVGTPKRVHPPALASSAGSLGRGAGRVEAELSPRGPVQIGKSIMKENH